MKSQCFSIGKELYESILILVIFGGVKVTFFCFKQLPLNIKQKFEFSYHLIDRERLISVVVGVVSFSVDKPLDFHDTTFSVSPNLIEV